MTHLIGTEVRESRIIWWRPWHDDVWFRHPFSGEAFVVSKRSLPLHWQHKLNDEGASRRSDADRP